MNEQFNKAVTATAFSFTLSKTQIEALCSVHQGFHTTESSQSFVAANAIARKGLVAARPYCNISEGYLRGAVHAIHHERYITRAGELMVELLKEAGLYQEFIVTEDSRDNYKIGRLR